jgi:hypothetical protein
MVAVGIESSELRPCSSSRARFTITILLQPAFGYRRRSPPESVLQVRRHGWGSRAGTQRGIRQAGHRCRLTIANFFCVRLSLPALGRASAALALAAAAWTAPAQAAPFHSSLKLQGFSFDVQAVGAGSVQDLTVKVSRAGHPPQVVKEQVEGRVIGADVEDLNSDGQPDLFVYIQSAGSGSYGSLKGWTTTKAGPLLPIHLQELPAKDAVGYQGHDQFAVVETSVVRRFPIYRSGDTNAKATGGIRQVTYKLVPGEAMWQLKPVGSTQF